MDSEDIVKKISSKKGPDPGSAIGKKFIPDPGGNKAPDLGSRIRIRNTGAGYIKGKVSSFVLKGQCHAIKVEMRPWSSSLDLH
jgi:hypothetical protein